MQKDQQKVKELLSFVQKNAEDGERMLFQKDYVAHVQEYTTIKELRTEL